MYILYLDESGAHGEASYFVLAGLAVFEREIYWFGQDLEAVQHKYFPEKTDPVFFHATRLRTKAGDRVESPWDELTPAQREELKAEVYDIIGGRSAVLFACAVEMEYARARGRDPYEIAFEDLVSRFDLFMGRINRQAGVANREEQRGLIVLAQSSSAKTLAILAQRLQQQGTQWRNLHNVTDIPYFAPARDTRLLQYADFCANAVFGRFNSKLTGDFDRIAHKFDRDENALHGLAHLSRGAPCSCPVCVNRQFR